MSGDREKTGIENNILFFAADQNEKPHGVWWPTENQDFRYICLAPQTVAVPEIFTTQNSQIMPDLASILEPRKAKGCTENMPDSLKTLEVIIRQALEKRLPENKFLLEVFLVSNQQLCLWIHRTSGRLTQKRFL